MLFWTFYLKLQNSKMIRKWSGSRKNIDTDHGSQIVERNNIQITDRITNFLMRILNWPEVYSDKPKPSWTPVFMGSDCFLKNLSHCSLSFTLIYLLELFWVHFYPPLMRFKMIALGCVNSDSSRNLLQHYLSASLHHFAWDWLAIWFILQLGK